MSNIEGHPHPAGATERLEYAQAHVDADGRLSHIVVVTAHRIEGITFDRRTTIYRINPEPGERDLAAVLTLTRRTNLQTALAGLAAAVTAADTLADPAPPVPQPVA